LWAIAERAHAITEITLGTPPVVVVHPLDGVPDGLDTEALAWLGGDQFAIGTEGQQAPTASVLYATLGGDGHVRVDRERPLLPAELGVTLTNNHGAEGLCGSANDLVVAIETVGTFADGARWAPLVRLSGDTALTFRFRLTTRTGKLSALSCRFAADGTVDIEAIERHYGVSRIVHGTITAHDPDVRPTVELDLDPVNHDRYNLEGLVRLADGRWVAINDNQGSRVDGPTELFVFHPR
jgi:Esterase-like activity of phytase